MRNDSRWGLGLAVLVAMMGGCRASEEVPSPGSALTAGFQPLARTPAPELVKDLFSASGAHPYALTNVNGTLFFLTANEHGYDRQLWKSDGSAAGTERIVAFAPRNRSLGDPRRITGLNGRLYIENDEEWGPHLWKSDGTSAGTAPVTPPFVLLMGDMVKVKDTLFFPADGREGTGLWKSDGTEAGTVLVRDITPDKCLVAVKDELFFSVYMAPQGSQGSWGLWKSDGTGAGTVLVKDFGPGVFSSGPCTVPDTALEGKDFVLLTADDGFGATLWKSDGTGAGTVSLHDAGPQGRPFAPQGFARVGDTVFFSARGDEGRELWKTDGTAAGTVLVKDIHPGGDSSPGSLTNVNGTLFFLADDGLHGVELWKSDGTPGGTVLVKDIHPGPQGSNASHLFSADGLLLLSADEGIHGEEPWVSDGTEAGTRLLADISPGAGSSSPRHFTRAGDSIFFQATEPWHGTELWRLPGVLVEHPPTMTRP